MVKEKKQEFTLRITRANKSQLIVILYDMVLEYLQDAIAAYEKNDRVKYKNDIGNAKNCIDELIQSLKPGYEISSTLQSLYYFYKRELSSAAILEKKELVLPVISMIRELRDAYEKASEQDTSAPIMENTQTVYAGLTYGRDSLNINLSDQGGNRGFCV